MKELNRDELLAVKGGDEVQVVVGFAVGECNGYCNGQPETPQTNGHGVVIDRHTDWEVWEVWNQPVD